MSIVSFSADLSAGFLVFLSYSSARSSDALPKATCTSMRSIYWRSMESTFVKSPWSTESGNFASSSRRAAAGCLYLNHVEASGVDLFRLACEQDLEGIVAKPKQGIYGVDGTWLKVRNREYSQAERRHEFFNDSLRVGLTRRPVMPGGVPELRPRSAPGTLQRPTGWTRAPRPAWL